MTRVFTWRCPHCNQHASLTPDLHKAHFNALRIENAVGRIGVQTQFRVCPNSACRKPTIEVALREYTLHAGDEIQGEVKRRWRLMPEGDGRPFPDFVPQAIREDYEEACLIRDLSPKSAATLARRALQGILRDFYKVKPGRLVDEIKAVQDKMAPELWDAVEGIRTVGNIGAHMEKDINVIVEVDPDEAELLIKLVESIIEETYVHRDVRQKRLRGVAVLAATKEDARRAALASAPGDGKDA